MQRELEAGLWVTGCLLVCSGRKSCAITTARRLGEFLGDERIKVSHSEGCPTYYLLLHHHPAISVLLITWCCVV